MLLVYMRKDHIKTICIHSNRAKYKCCIINTYFMCARLVKYNLFVNACPGFDFTYKCMLTFSDGLNRRLWDSVGSNFLKIK